MILLEYLPISYSRRKITLAEVGCGVAVAGTLLVTASAVTLGSAAAPGFGTVFGFWIASKVVATVGVVTSCGTLKRR